MLTRRPAMHPSVIGDPDAPPVYHRTRMALIAVHRTRDATMSAQQPADPQKNLIKNLGELVALLLSISTLSGIVWSIVAGNVKLAVVLLAALIPMISLYALIGDKALSRVRWLLSFVRDPARKRQRRIGGFIGLVLGSLLVGFLVYALYGPPSRVYRAAVVASTCQPHRFCFLITDLDGNNKGNVTQRLNNQLQSQFDTSQDPVDVKILRHSDDQAQALTDAHTAGANIVVWASYTSDQSSSGGDIYWSVVRGVRHVPSTKPFQKSLTTSPGASPTFNVKVDDAIHHIDYFGVLFFGLYRYESGQYPDAINRFDQATGLASQYGIQDNGVAYFYRGSAYYARGANTNDFTQASLSMDAALQQHPPLALVKVYDVDKGIADAGIPDYKAAKQILEPTLNAIVGPSWLTSPCNALRAKDAPSGAYYWIGLIYAVYDRDSQRAIQALLGARCLDPTNPAVYYNLGAQHVRIWIAHAASDARKGIPYDIGAANHDADLNAAFDYATQATHLAPSYWYPYATLALIYQARGDSNQASMNLQRAKTLVAKTEGKGADYRMLVDAIHHLETTGRLSISTT